MADLARKLPQVAAGRPRRCCDAGAAILGIAFLVKAGMWPLNFWLPRRLRRGQRAGRGAVRHPHQGRRLRRAAPVDCCCFRRTPAPRRCRRRRCSSWRHGDAGLRRDRHARVAAARPPRRLQPARLVGHAARGHRLRRAGADRRPRCSTSSARRWRRLRAVPAGRAARTRSAQVETDPPPRGRRRLPLPSFAGRARRSVRQPRRRGGAR